MNFVLHLMGAAGCALGVVWMLKQPVTKRRDRVPTLVALILTGIWAATVSAFGFASQSAFLAETIRNLAWFVVLYRLFSHDGRDKSLGGVRPAIGALIFVELMQPVLLFVANNWAVTPELADTTVHTMLMFRILVAIGSVVLLHNLYDGAGPETRSALRWSIVGLAGFWVFEMNFYVVAYLAGSLSVEFAAVRGVVAALMVIPLALGASNGLAGRKLQASHTVAFQTFSLLAIGGYLVLMFFAAQLLSLIEGNGGRLAQIGFLVAAGTVALLWLPSDRLRAWFRVTVLKHLFQHRYDYREEWMRFARTIGQAGDDAGLYERAAKSMADIVESPAALLFLPGDDGLLREAAAWNWPTDKRTNHELPGGFSGQSEQEGYIIELDDMRQDRDNHTLGLPQSLLDDDTAWALVPLVHFDRLMGAVLLSKPASKRSLDWEDFDLLKVVARQLASYLGEHESHRALMESAQFDDFNRRIAFVMHDIKNLASQLALLARNAEKHAENPEFRKDMLVTLRNGADKLNSLLARLGRYGTGGSAVLREVHVPALAKAVVDRFDTAQSVGITRLEECSVLADPDGLEQALVHLIQNAVDASEDGMPVSVDISTDGLMGKIEVIDSGTGMDAEFLRHRLFKPFVSSKDGGFGIGAFEARELIRAMGGRLDVQSREGVGTRFLISVPLAEAAKLLNSNTSQEAA